MQYRVFSLLVLFVSGAVVMPAQVPTAPVVNPRGVTNYFTQLPAPARVGQGGLIQITGLNLGPPEGATADKTPWATNLGGVQVVFTFLNQAGASVQRPAPIYSVSPGVVIAQVPYEVPAGLVEVVVRRQSGASSPARIQVTQMEPAVRTAADAGFGAPWGDAAGQSLTLLATGLGLSDPRVPSGDVPASDAPAKPANPVVAFVGGLRASATAVTSTKVPGQFEISVPVPEGSRAGDLISLVAGTTGANRTVLRPTQTVEVDFVPLPEGTPNLLSLTDTGVNGQFLMATGARNAEGCFPAFVVDMRQKTVRRVPDCLTSLNANIPALISPAESDTLAALIGPPSGDQQTGISSKVKIFSAAADPITVDLPGPAALLAATATDYRATLPGTPPRVATIDDRTGEVRMQQAAAGVGGGGGGGGAQPINPGAFEIDGLKNIYANAVLSQNPVRVALIAGDDPLKPTQAKFAILNQAGESVVTRGFPEGWLPLLAAPQPARPNVIVPSPRASFYLDGPRRAFYALARAKDDSKHALIAFPFDDSEAKLVPLPDGWFATACVANIPVFPLELSRRVALMASKVAETEFKQSCTSSGFLLLDLATQAVSAVPMPVQAQVLANGASEMNDYVYASGYDNTRTNTADTLFVLDGVNGNTFSITVPSNISGYTDNAAQIRRIPDLNALIAPATRTVVGDQGLVFFNLDAQSVAVLPIPDGYDRVALPAADGADGQVPCCLATRKLVGRSFRTGGAGIVVYNLLTNDVAVASLPEGVTSIGQPAAVAGQGGGQGGGTTPPGGGTTPPGGGTTPPGGGTTPPGGGTTPPGGGTAPPGGGTTPPGGGTTPPGGGVVVPGAGGGAAVANVANGLVAPNVHSNTVAAIAQNGNRQVGIIVVRVP